MQDSAFVLEVPLVGSHVGAVQVRFMDGLVVFWEDRPEFRLVHPHISFFLAIDLGKVFIVDDHVFSLNRLHLRVSSKLCGLDLLECFIVGSFHFGVGTLLLAEGV